MSPVERQFQVRGRTMAARCWHAADKPPVLALHGWLDNAATFDLLAPELAGYHLVAPDFAGHGLSDHRPPGVRYHLSDHVDDVLALLDQLGWSRCILLGHSMGAGIAAMFAAALPERVERLVMIEGLGPYTGEPSAAAHFLREAVLEWRDHVDAPPRRMASFDLAVRARMQGLLPVAEDAARRLCARGVRAVEGGYVWTADRRLRLRSPVRFAEEQVCGLLAAVKAPSLLVVAERSLPFDERAYAARVAALAGVRVERLPGGHHLHLDGDVAMVAGVIRSFLATEPAGE